MGFKILHEDNEWLVLEKVPDRITTCLLGARSLAAGKLLELLLEHPYVDIGLLIASEVVDIEKEHPRLRGFMNHQKTEPYNAKKILNT